eukprot:3317171-Amphidinium_carterae.1
MLGAHTICTASTTQVPISLSSGEAEYYACVKTGSRLLGMVQLLRDFGYSMQAVLYTDSAAAKGICSRRGCGKVRHLEVPTLWLQDAMQRGRMAIKKIDGSKNPADLMTKHLDQTSLRKHCSRLNLRLAQ